MTAADAENDILVVGAGIIGICVATQLAEAGRSVLVVDRSGVCEETSSGNAAALAFTDVLPFAQKNLLRHVPGWLADPLGPLAIPPAYLPKLLPWLYRFWRAGMPGNYESALKAEVALMRHAEATWMELIDRAGTRSMLREDGSLELYESEGEFKASLPAWAVRDRFGIPYRHMNPAEFAQMQPGLSRGFTHATFVPGWKTVGDPQHFSKAIWAYAETRGARVVRGTVDRVESDGRGAVARMADGTALKARTLVIAAGAWSHLLARQLGDRIPLEAERGYNTTLPPGAFDVKRQLIFPGHGFVITPLSTGLRVGGAVELGGLTRPPNFARSKAMLEKARRFLPGLKTEGGREWMGYRPSLPDSLPVIGRSSRANIYYAFGHGHGGLTQGAATGSLIRDLVLGRQPAIDVAPFSPARF
ncbi:MAG: FAD-binding oxidoreductase [Rhizobiaceae bacterium]|nr:FAD-binding oxidoreductase [Rhizobiaceae bacterium]